MNYHIELKEGVYYHIFSRAIGDEKMFRGEDDYFSFLNRIERFLLSVFDIYAYSLIPNHFHLLVRVKTQDEINQHCVLPAENKVDENISRRAIHQFSKMLNSYTKTFNRKYDRKGGLFINRFKRVEVNDESHFCSEVFYIHKNAVHHGLTTRIDEWPYCSFPALINPHDKSPIRLSLMEVFGGYQKFMLYHEREIYRKEAHHIT